jgi:hypothetical protein
VWSGEAAPADSPWPARLGLAYFSEVPTSLNTVLTCVPTSWTATMMNTAIRLAISALDRRHTGFIAKKVSNSKHGILLTLYGPLRSQAAAVPKPRLLKWVQDPDHDAKSHPPIANRSIGQLKFYRPPIAGRDCSLILNLVPIRTQK